MPNLPIGDIVDISVDISAVSTVRNGFNLGLIVGSSAVIDATERVRIYSDVESMITDGFTLESAEYKAAVLYFSAKLRPDYVAIGYWNSVGETVVDALMDCRAKNTEWYGCMVCGLQKADILLAAAYIEVAAQSSTFFYTTTDVEVLTKVAGNVMIALQALEYKRTIGQYSTHTDAVAAILGYAMGANTGLENSMYTLAYKKEIGVTTEDLTATQVLNIKDQNGNVYISRGNTYNLFEQGVMANGQYFDEILGIDMLVHNIQLSVLDLLTSATKVPQTEDGVSLLINAISRPCVASRNIGFIAPGVWNAAPVLSLKTGDMLSQGFLILSKSIASQSVEDRAARIAPPIYVCAKLSGAIEFVNIQIIVNR